MTRFETEPFRCPRCKGAFQYTRGRLACVACHTTHRWSTELEAWDLRVRDPRPGLHGMHASRAASVDRGSWDRTGRMWRALRHVHGELSRQGLLLQIDVASPDPDEVLEDAFSGRVTFATSAERLVVLRRGRESHRPSPIPTLALVDPDALPLASQSIDLVDADILGQPEDGLEPALSETHRVLGRSGHAYLTGAAAGAASMERVDRAARGAFADGFGWVPPGAAALPGARALAVAHRHAQMWLGFEYTIGRGIQARRRSVLLRLVGRLARTRELVCWRTRPDSPDWKRTSSDEPMVFGRFHFPPAASAS